MNMRVAVANIYRMMCLASLALAIAQPAYAADGVITTLVTKGLEIVFLLGGGAAVLGGAWVGVNLILGSAMSASQVVARSMMSILGVVGGLILVIAAPNMTQQIIDALQLCERRYGFAKIRPHLMMITAAVENAVALCGNSVTLIGMQHSVKVTCILNVSELAALWHLPHGEAGVQGIAYTSSRQLLAPAGVLAEDGVWIGQSRAAGQIVAARLARASLRGNIGLWPRPKAARAI